MEKAVPFQTQSLCLSQGKGSAWALSKAHPGPQQMLSLGLSKAQTGPLHRLSLGFGQGNVFCFLITFYSILLTTGRWACGMTSQKMFQIPPPLQKTSQKKNHPAEHDEHTHHMNNHKLPVTLSFHAIIRMIKGIMGR
jgi:hypothetical protein